MPKIGRSITPTTHRTIPNHLMYDDEAPLYSPPPVARVKPEAEAIALKSRGSMGKWLRVDDNLEAKYETSRPVARAPTSVARKGLEKSRGCMSQYIGAGSEHRPMKVQTKHPPRTVKSEAADIAQNHKGRGMNNLLTKYGDLTPSARPVPRMKPEAEGIAAGHKGRATASLFHNYGNVGVSSRIPRVKPEANDIYEKYQKGTGINRLIHQDATRRSARPASCPNRESPWDTRPKSPQEKKLESYNRRNASTLVTKWE